MIVDTSALLALFNSEEPQHDAVAAALSGHGHDPLVVSPYVLAEVDYLVATRVGIRAEIAVLQGLAGGAMDLAAFGRNDLDAVVGVITRYADRAIGLADASLVVLAQRYGTRTVATLDRRHFTVLRRLAGGLRRSRMAFALRGYPDAARGGSNGSRKRRPRARGPIGGSTRRTHSHQGRP